MNKFFYAKSIAIIGVSDTPYNLGIHLVRNLIQFDFKGRFYTVGVGTKEILGRPIYRSVLDIPDEVEMAVIVIQAKFVPEIVEECGRKGIRRIVILSAGFSEYRSNKSVIEERILKIRQQYDMRLIGPNCLGLVNMDNGLFLPFGKHFAEDWLKGPVGIISQSGNVSINYSEHLSFEKIGVSKVASIGNKLDVDEVDMLQFYLEDPETKIIFLYLEGFSRARDLISLAMSSKKPIIIQKSNQSSLSHEIAQSHTKALASNNKIVSGAFRQAGIIHVDNLDEMIHCVKVLLLPPLGGKRLVCIAATGGKAVMCADECERYGFDLPELSAGFLDWRRTLGRGEYINPTNPLDLGDIYDLETQIDVIRKLQDLEDVDGVFYVLPYSAWSDNLNCEKVFDLCRYGGNDSVIPVLLYIDFESSKERCQFYERYTARCFNSISVTFKALKQVWDAQKSRL